MSTRAVLQPPGPARSVVMADLSGSSRLFALLGTNAAARFMTHCLDAMAASSGRHGGRVIKRLGDGLLLWFETARAALEASVALQREHRRRLAGSPAALRLPLRVGLACGELALLDDDCYGEAISLAARLSELAGDGQVWATEDVLLAQPASVRTRDLGLVALRGITGPRRLLQVEWGEGTDSGLLTLHGELLPAPAAARGELLLWFRHAERCWRFTAAQLPITLGRGEHSDLLLCDNRVSRRHARIESRAGSPLLTDLSSYGTWLRPQGSTQELPLRRTACLLHGRGEIALGAPFASPGVPVLAYSVEDAG